MPVLSVISMTQMGAIRNECRSGSDGVRIEGFAVGAYALFKQIQEARYGLE